MFKYVCKRLLLLVPVLLGVVTIVFLIMRVFATDPSENENILGKYATEEVKIAWKSKNGLDKPLAIQYVNYLKGIFSGNFGNSYRTNKPVMEEISERFPATIELAIMAIILASVFGVLIGLISAVKKNSIFDNIGMAIALIGVSIPIFWFGLIIIKIFSGWTGLPSNGRINSVFRPEDGTGFYLLDSLLQRDFEAFWDAFKHMILPAITLAMYSIAVIARMTRSSVLETLNKDYVRTARAKGLKENTVVFKHAFRNALIPIVTVIGLQFGSLLAGAVLTESVFSWPGIGKYAVDCIQNSDFPVIQGIVILTATSFVFVNLFVDVVYAFLDPRIKFSSKKGE
ncbi:MAG: ABC transporter permease [Oscillospiraceae bacterium]|jgi:peptide/nickel transport system permease protein|nr:ABC transporter permease [Oscillospiraceae bacterium]